MILRGRTSAERWQSMERGEVSVELRQIETMTVVNKETGEELEFEVTGFTALQNPVVIDPDFPFETGAPLLKIFLGKRVR